MLRSYHPIYELAADLHERRNSADLFEKQTLGNHQLPLFRVHLAKVRRVCSDYGFTHTAALAKLAEARTQKSWGEIFSELTHLSDSLGHELENDSVLRIPSEQAAFYEKDTAFGLEVADAFPSCARDIRKAGSCYALGQEEGCVHHLMMVLERGLNAVAIKMEVPYQQTNWQPIIDGIGSKLRGTPRSPERDFYREINTQFGLLKDAYRNHSQHVRDNPYDMAKALHIFNHVREFMCQLASRCDEEGNPRG